jgi:prevent-host-death family protein
VAAEVSVRELRQNLSVYLRRVQAGEALRVTARGPRGRPVAMLTPLPEAGLWERMVAEGRIQPAAQDEGELPPPVAGPEGRRIGEALDELREDSV